MLFKKYINVCYGIDKIWWSYEKTDDKIKESKEVSKKASETLQKLLENIGPMPEYLEKIYKGLDTFLKIDNFSSDEAIQMQDKLINEQRKLLWPKYNNLEEAQEAIKIYNVIFLEQDASVEEAVDTISKVFDDKDIPQSIKLKLAKSLRNILPHMVTKTPSLIDIEGSTLDDGLKDIYNNLKNYNWEIPSIEDYNKLVSYQDILYSPKYRNNKNVYILQGVISELMWIYNPMLDVWKWIEISNGLIKKYPNYNWELEYSFPQV